MSMIVRTNLALIFSITILFFKNAYSDVDSLSSLLDTDLNDEERIEVLIDLSIEIKPTNPQKSLEYSRKALELSLETGSDKKLGIAYKVYGNSQLDMRLYFDAIENYNKAYEIAIDQKDSVLLSQVLNNLAYSYLLISHYEKSVSYSFKALKICNAINNDIMEASIYNILGAVYTEWGKSVKALHYYNKSLELAEKLGIHLTKAAVIQNIALIHDNMNNDSLALKYYTMASDILDSMNEIRVEAMVINNIGNIYVKMKEYKKALNYFFQADSLFNQINYIWLETPLSIANCYLKSNDLESTKKYLDIYNKQLDTNSSSRTDIRYYNIRSKLKEKAGDYIGALEDYKEFERIQDSLYNQDTETKLTEIEKRFEFDIKDSEINMLKKDQEINELKLKRRKLVLLFLIFIIILIALVFFTINKRIRDKRKAEKNLQEKEKIIHEQEIQRYKEELIQKNKELTSKAMFLIENKELLTKVIENLELIKLQTKTEANKKHLKAIIKELKSNLLKDIWKEFIIYFEQVHEEFYKKLNDRYPELTPGERKLCAFLRLNLSTKDIASITYKSHGSIDNARTKLRKKFNLDREANLVNFLADL